MSKNEKFTLISSSEAVARMNLLGKNSQPFLFIFDFKANNAIVLTDSEIDNTKILFQFEKNSNTSTQTYSNSQTFTFKRFPLQKTDYLIKFNQVKQNIQRGNSFLTNFTQPTPIQTNISLQEIFYRSNARFKLWLKDWFVVFSPEIFVRIKNGKISSYPMKGTIDASMPHAERDILNSAKEKAEHATIVDLIRNDLSMVSENVDVKRFRYVEKIRTNKTDLLQVSSHIEGDLPKNYKENIGSILHTLLPAGSISGAPKPKTLEIIEKTENYSRGFYTGICGYFDGECLESAVMIRFIEQIDNKLVFKSGGGITFMSDGEKEYEELIQKVYVPIY